MGRAIGLAILLFALTAALLWWALAATPDADERPHGAFTVYVVGPTALLHEGTVEVADADALRVLQALAAREAFVVQVDDLAGCQYDYVRSVAGHGETATGGWNYYLRGDEAGAQWTWQDRAASCGGLSAGDDVLWCWVEPDEVCAVYPD